jgi:RNase P subunit RPR2
MMTLVPNTSVLRVSSASNRRDAKTSLVRSAVLALALGVTTAFAQSADYTAPPSRLPQINPNGWTSSAICGECHQAIHAVWQHSLHAKSWSNGVFQAAYRRSIDAYGEEGARVCLSCHAPTVRQGQDFAVKDPVTAEGVTCDFCHSIAAIDLDAADPFRVNLEKTKYGPLRHAQSPAHQIVDTSFHKNSEFCGPCHEYRNAQGVTVLGTYSEWKESTYARQGKQCQDCHMPLVPGRVVALNIKEKTPTSVNLHDISGSHDMERVRKAITLEISGYEWHGDRVWLFVKVSNVGSGHCFPTGMPMHRAVLDVSIHDGLKLVDRREIPFEIVMLDKEGRPLHREYEVLVKAVSVRSDTRLRPGESRSLDLSFRDITAPRLTVTAALSYEYSTEALVTTEGETRIEPVEMKFLIASRQSSMKPPGR